MAGSSRRLEKDSPEPATACRIISDSQVFCDALAEALNRRGLQASAHGRGDALNSEDEPDSALIVDMSSGAVWDAVDALCALADPPRLVLVNVQETMNAVATCARTRAMGCALRSCPLDELAALLRRVLAGEIVYAGNVGGLLFESFGPEEAPLTPREQQVLELIRRGYANKEIARVLTIELATVKNHVHRIFLKTGAKRRTELLVRGASRSVVPQARGPFGASRETARS